MEDPRAAIESRLQALVSAAPQTWDLDACGVTRSERRIPVLLANDAYSATSSRLRVLLVGGLSGARADVDMAFAALESYAGGGELLSQTISLSAAPCVNPDGLAPGSGPGNGVGGNPSEGYPPANGFYDDERDPEARYLWRWTSFLAPDLVIEVRAGHSSTWETTVPTVRDPEVLGASEMPRDDSLASALGLGNPSGVGSIPALRLTCPADVLNSELSRLWAIRPQLSAIGPSPAHRTLDRRGARSPLNLSRLLASVYGGKLDVLNYTQAVGVSGRLRLASVDPESAKFLPEMVRLVEPYVAGELPMFGQAPTGSNLAAVVWTEDIAEVTVDDRYVDLLVNTARRYRTLSDRGMPGPSDPDYRVEDMFYGSAILGRASKMTGDTSFLDIQAKFLVEAQVQQENGLFWHSRGAPYYWGRGNGFAALGYAELLSYMPEDHPGYRVLLDAHRRHLSALIERQTVTGGWLQVLDFPGSYPEMSATCMIGYALARGLRRGWLDSSFAPALGAAWRFVVRRVDDEGGLTDVCASTGVQSSLREYLDRPAVSGHDDRGGSLALWFAVEIERYRQEAA